MLPMGGTMAMEQEGRVRGQLSNAQDAAPFAKNAKGSWFARAHPQRDSPLSPSWHVSRVTYDARCLASLAPLDVLKCPLRGCRGDVRQPRVCRARRSTLATDHSLSRSGRAAAVPLPRPPSLRTPAFPCSRPRRLRARRARIDAAASATTWSSTRRREENVVQGTRPSPATPVCCPVRAQQREDALGALFVDDAQRSVSQTRPRKTPCSGSARAAFSRVGACSGLYSGMPWSS